MFEKMRRDKVKTDLQKNLAIVEEEKDSLHIRHYAAKD